MATSNETNYWAKMQVIGLPFAMQDLVRFCLGDFISSGQYRMVFEWDMRPNTVVKFCSADDCEANWNEYAVCLTKRMQLQRSSTKCLTKQ